MCSTKSKNWNRGTRMSLEKELKLAIEKIKVGNLDLLLIEQMAVERMYKNWCTDEDDKLFLLYNPKGFMRFINMLQKGLL